jgi:glycosyltransferase involved in cell wall biosynthesis
MGDRLRPVEMPGGEPRRGRKTWRTRLETLRHDIWWTQWALLRAAKRTGADLLHVPSLLAPTRSTMPLIVTIHDLSVLRFPDKFPRWFRTWVGLTLPRVVSYATLVITDSEASRLDLLNAWSHLEGRIAVVPLGIPSRPPPDLNSQHLARTQRAYGLDAPFVLTVGSLEPRKNIPRLLQAIHRLRNDPATREIRLVHVGPPGWLDQETHATISALGLAGAVRFIGYVPDADLPVLYQMARVTAYPSLFEGFGLPIVEAMASGCPVVTSGVSSMPEVAGGAALLVDPTDVDDIVNAISRLWLDEELRQRQRALGLARAAQLSVENMARATLEVYCRVSAAH